MPILGASESQDVEPMIMVSPESCVTMQLAILWLLFDKPIHQNPLGKKRPAQALAFLADQVS